MYHKHRAIIWKGALCVLAILLVWFVYIPLEKYVTLRYYYTREEIERQNLRVEDFPRRGGRPIVFSNGDRRWQEPPLTLMLTGIFGAFILGSVAATVYLSGYFTRSTNDATKTNGETS